MRQVLLDHARMKSADKRRIKSGGDCGRVDDVVTTARLTKAIHYPVVEGLILTETADRLGISVKQVRTDCDFGLSWMANQL